MVELCDVYWLCVFVLFVTRGAIRFLFYISPVVIIRPWTSVLPVHDFVQYTEVCEDVALQIFIPNLIT